MHLRNSKVVSAAQARPLARGNVVAAFPALSRTIEEGTPGDNNPRGRLFTPPPSGMENVTGISTVMGPSTTSSGDRRFHSAESFLRSSDVSGRGNDDVELRGRFTSAGGHPSSVHSLGAAPLANPHPSSPPPSGPAAPRFRSDSGLPPVEELHQAEPGPPSFQGSAGLAYPSNSDPLHEGPSGLFTGDGHGGPLGSGPPHDGNNTTMEIANIPPDNAATQVNSLQVWQ